MTVGAVAAVGLKNPVLMIDPDDTSESPMSAPSTAGL